jgi:hypothetical protein
MLVKRNRQWNWNHWIKDPFEFRHNRIKMEDFKNLEFLAVNSKEIIEKQVDSYRQQHSYAGTIIGVTALFIPFFLSSLDKSSQVLQFISIIPIVIFITAIFLLLSIFKDNQLDQGINVEKFKSLENKTFKEVLLYEINANTIAYSNNKIKVTKVNKKYASGVRMTTIAIIFSIVILLVNKLIAYEKTPINVKVIGFHEIHSLNCITYYNNSGETKCFIKSNFAG